MDLGIRNAIAVPRRRAIHPDERQIDCVAWALGRTVGLVRGPPGTGNAHRGAPRVVALRLAGADNKKTPRVLAVTHSNGAADVLLAALHLAGVNAIRAGRPTAVAPEARHFTAVALAEDTQRSYRCASVPTTRRCRRVRSDAMRQAPVHPKT